MGNTIIVIKNPLISRERKITAEYAGKYVHDLFMVVLAVYFFIFKSI